MTIIEARTPSISSATIIVTKKAGPLAALGLEYDPVHQMAYNAGEEHDECIYHALYQRQRHHVAVGRVRNLMPQHGLGFLSRHLLQQTGGHGDE